MSDHPETSQLIDDFHRNNRRFRFFQTLFMVCVIAALLFGYFLIYNNFNNQSKQRAEGLIAINEEMDGKIDELTNKLQCITNFFAQADRANLIITEPNECFTRRLDNGDIRQLQSSPDPANSNENNNTDGNTSQAQTNNQDPDQNQPPEAGSGEEVVPPVEDTRNLIERVRDFFTELF